MDLLKQNIQQTAEILVGQIRDYVRSQKELWKQIPALALEADGRGGYSYKWAYYEKGWAIESRDDTPIVDLETGELICPVALHFGHRRELIDNGAILYLALSLDLVNASKIIDRLKVETQRKDGSLDRSAEETKEWREEMRQQYGIEKPEI